MDSIMSIELEKLLDENERNYWKVTGKKMLKHWRLYLLFLPLFLTFLLWRYFPIYGLLNAFQVDVGAENIPVSQRAFAGLYNFRLLMFGSNSADFWVAFRNTFVLSFYGLLFGFPVPIILALFFNEVKNDVVRSGFQVLTYLPRFISMVIITSILTLLLQSKTPGTDTPGVVANFLANIGIISRENAEAGILGITRYFRPIFIISGIWENAGYASIVFFAAVVMIPKSRYEAATIDGANKWAQIRYIVLPGMASTIMIMLVLRIGELLNVGFEKVLLLQQANYAETNIISTFVLRMAGIYGGGRGNQALASAADLIAALLSMVLVLGSNFVVKRITKVSVY
ncbi:MAG: ABC transporter permease subunit [Clostridiales bacterium]|jgi:putative aldouronate transport system permease protein|nr:ABC transporter permease subunit [Clostridiales bacterium]